jgi:predicted deacylase
LSAKSGCWNTILEAGKTTYGSLEFEGHLLPMSVSAGKSDGPVLLVIGMQHGTEFSGPAALDRVLSLLDPESLSGRLVGLPFVNPFHARLSREEHRRMHREPSTNLNRQWVGRDNGGNPLSRLAARVWDEAVQHADFVVDMHCCRNNDPRFAACLDGHAASEALAEATGLEAVDRQSPDSYDSRQLMLAAAEELDIPAILLESRPGGYQTPEAVEACSNAIFRALVHAGVLSDWSPEPMTDPLSSVFVRHDKGLLLRAEKEGYLGIHRYPARTVAKGDTIAVVRSMETFAVIESMDSPIDGAVSSVAEFADRPFITPGDCGASVKPIAERRL